MSHQIVKVVTSIFHFLCACKGAKGVHPGLRAAQVPGGWSDAIAHLPGLIMIIIRYTGISVAMGWDEDIFSRQWLICEETPDLKLVRIFEAGSVFTAGFSAYLMV